MSHSPENPVRDAEHVMLALREQLRERYEDGAAGSILGAHIYLPTELSEVDFDEADYLEINPDVAYSVSIGETKSGYEHWISRGKREGRRYRHTMTELHRRVRDSAGEASEYSNRIGQLPPVPPTWRGRFGASVVRVMRRVLAWYTHTLQMYAAANHRLMNEHSKLLDALCAADGRQKDEIRSLRAAVGQLLATQTAAEDSSKQPGNASLEDLTRNGRSSRQDSAIGAISELLQNTILDFNARTAQLVSHLQAEIDSGRWTAHHSRARSINGKQDGTPPFLQFQSGTVDMGHPLVVECAARELVTRRLASALEQIDYIQGRMGGAKVPGNPPGIDQGQWSCPATTPPAAIPSGTSSSRNALPSVASETALRELYLSFESHFRGSIDESRPRRSIYEPVLEQARAGSASRPIVDLGFGMDRSLGSRLGPPQTADGARRNPVSGRTSIWSEFPKLRTEIFPFLQAAPPASLGAITAIHIVEHLQMTDLIELIDQSLRALAGGGVLILETTSPVTLLTASDYFWLDPSCLNSLPSELLRFTVESRGFSMVEVRDPLPVTDGMHHSSQLVRLVDASSRQSGVLRDYAVIAFKPE